MIYVFQQEKMVALLDRWDLAKVPSSCYVLAKNGWFRVNGRQLEKVRHEHQVPQPCLESAKLMARTVGLISG